MPDPAPQSKVMLSLELPADEASLPAVRQRLGLDAAEIDAGFGVIPIDPDHGLYTVLVTPEAAERVKGTPGVSGPFANPPIEPI
jgi:hypothetical protein